MGQPTYTSESGLDNRDDFIWKEHTSANNETHPYRVHTGNNLNGLELKESTDLLDRYIDAQVINGNKWKAQEEINFSRT